MENKLSIFIFTQLQIILHLLYVDQSACLHPVIKRIAHQITKCKQNERPQGSVEVQFVSL